jgi:DNA modification methylase
MKPIELVANAIENSSELGDKIMDLFGGSGSTLIACEQTGRKCFMMELDPHYVAVILKRWEDFTGRKAEKVAQ